MEATAPATSPQGTLAPAPPPPAPPPPPQHPPKRSPWRLIIGGVVLLAVLAFGVRWMIRSFGVVSTDDAYVNGHVTYVAPRVPGQIARVLVEDNNRVRKGDLLVQLDKEPYEVQLAIAKAALDAAESDVVVATSQTRAVEGQMRSLRFNLQHAIEDVDNQVASLRARVATLKARRANLEKAQVDDARFVALVKANAASPDEVDRHREQLHVAEAEAEEALQQVYQTRAALGIPMQPEGNGGDLSQVPEDLNQTASSVRQAQAMLVQAAAQAGVSDSFNKTPRQLVTDFYKRDPSGDIDKIYEQILRDAPAVKQAQARLAQAQRAVDHAHLNLKYCDVVAEIDGVVTRREANPGNNVLAGQGLMAVRSLTEVWIDANFKETQLARLRIGQDVVIDTDIYGSRHTFKGRISGFTAGTGSTLALLPPENATGNFVKVVQRLPVRIELVDYDPDVTPLFNGLSVTPRVNLRGALSGPNAGKVLQPYLSAAPTLAPSALAPAPSRAP